MDRADNRPALTARSSQAAAAAAAGHWAAAREQFAALLPDLERVLGAEHPDTLSARASLAELTWRASAPADHETAQAARDQFAALVPELQRVLGAEHPATLAARVSLTFWTRAPWAVDQLAALLGDLERVLGAEHPATLTARGRCAQLRGDDGDFEAARHLFAALVPDLERLLGAEHPATLTARASLAEWTGMAGFGLPAVGVRRVFQRVRLRFQRDFLWGGRCRCLGCARRAAARDQLAALLPDLERVLGAEHSDTLGARWSLAMWTAEAGDAADGRDQYAALLPDLERVWALTTPRRRPRARTLHGRLAWLKTSCASTVRSTR